MNRSKFQFQMTKVQRISKTQAPKPSLATNAEPVTQLERGIDNWTLEFGTSLGFGPWELDFVRQSVAWSVELPL